MVRLIVRNIGKDPAEPLKLETSCGCLAAGTLPKKIAPDQAAVVDLRLRTLSLPTGPHAWRVRLTYAPSAENLAVQKEVETRLSTVVRRELEVEPAIMALSLGAGGEAETLVKVKDLRELRRDRPGHARNAAMIHIAMVSMFVPFCLYVLIAYAP